MLPLDPLVVTIILLVAGVVASFVPLVPGGAVSILGIGYYWATTGELGTVLSARVGGASTRTTIVAAVVAIGLLFVLGPLGALLGVVGVVFLLEYLRHGDVRRGMRTAAVTAIGMLASTAMQVLLTVSMLVGFLLTVWL